MRLYPALEISHGAVALLGSNPSLAGGEEMGVGGQARRWAAAGAEWAHLVDLDAAHGGRSQWHHIPHAMGRRLRIQFGGGVRHMAQIQQLIDLGVERVVVGTQGVRNPLWTRELCKIFPRRIVLAIDACGRDIVVEGWKESTGLDVATVARGLDDAALCAFQYTSVTSDGEPAPLDRAIIQELRRSLRTPLLVGGIIPDLDTLAWLEQEGVHGAVLGQSVYDGSIDLTEALKKFPDRDPEPAPRRRLVNPVDEDSGQEYADSDHDGDPDDEGSWKIG